MNPGSSPGRTCPAHYGYSPRVFARAAELHAETLYVVGGLYGNGPALDEIERMAALESATLVFNGDFHWFDAEPDLFGEIDRRVRAHTALRGNVETELAQPTDEAGCGCAYPDSVSDAEVTRSNAILARLRTASHTAARGDLPMHLVAQVGEARIGIVHGDAWSLAGWRFAHDALFSASQSEFDALFTEARVDGFACSHTCLPALKVDMYERFIINNGAAGMPNFQGSRAGLITRIAVMPLPTALTPQRVYGAEVAGIYVDALRVDFDFAAWRAQFLEVWPQGSAAHVSYFERIEQGPQFTVDQALGRVTSRSCIAPFPSPSVPLPRGEGS